MTIEELLDALQAIIDQAADRSLTDEEVQRYEELETQLAAARKDVEIRSRHQAYTTPLRTDLHVHTGAGTTQDDTLERAFDHYLRTGKENADLVESRAQSEGTPSEGGYLVPDSFRDKIVERKKAFGGLASVVDEITTSDGRSMSWPTVDDTANEGEIVSENGTFASGADVVFGTANIGAYSYMAGGAGSTPLRLPLELVQDSAFDIRGLVSRLLGDRIHRIQAKHLVTGTGSGQPQGILDGLTGVEIAADTAGITYADLITFIHSVDPAYRESARWAFNDKTLAEIRKLVDGNNRPLLQPSSDGAAAGAPGGETLLGYPVTIDQAFPDFDADSNTTNWGVFGDLREGYLVRRVQSIEILVNPWTRQQYRQVEYTAWARMDAVQQNTNAYVALTGEQ